MPHDHRPEAHEDLLLGQAETIFRQRRARRLVIDKDILGEPGWDILLLAFIAARKPEVCDVDSAAAAIDLSQATTRRWIAALADKTLLVFHDPTFSLTPETDQKLAQMFKGQLMEIREAARTMPQDRTRSST